jgi:hypothetical protein
MFSILAICTFHLTPSSTLIKFNNVKINNYFVFWPSDNVPLVMGFPPKTIQVKISLKFDINFYDDTMYRLNYREGTRRWISYSYTNMQYLKNNVSSFSGISNPNVVIIMVTIISLTGM